jgi:hypothetical protein
VSIDRTPANYIAKPEPSTREIFQPRLLRASKIFLALCVALDVCTLVSLAYYHHVYHDAARTQIWSLADDRFGDFWHYRKLFEVFHTPLFFSSADRFAYPAPCAVLYNALYHLGPHPFLGFVAILVCAFLVSAWLFYRFLRSFRIAAGTAASFTAFLLLTSYPWEKLFDRANLELFVYIFLAAGVWAFLRRCNSWAAVFWGIAGALKIYPLVMVALFFHRRGLRPLTISLIVFAATLLASFYYVGPTIHAAAVGSLHGITGFVGNYAAAARIRELTIDHSLLGSIKELLLLDRTHEGNWAHLSTGYQAAVAILGPLLYLLRIRKLPALNQLCLFLVAIVLLPPVSYDYTLVHIYLVFGIVAAHFLSQAKAPGGSLQGIRTFAITFAITFSSEGWVQTQTLRLNGVIKCVSLLTLCWLLLRIPLAIRETQPAQQNVN